MYTTHRKIIIKQNTVFYYINYSILLRNVLLYFESKIHYHDYYEVFLLLFLRCIIYLILYTFFALFFLFLVCVGFVFCLLSLFCLYSLAYLLQLFLLMTLLLNFKLNRPHFLRQIKKYIICKYIIVWRYLPWEIVLILNRLPCILH